MFERKISSPVDSGADGNACFGANCKDGSEAALGYQRRYGDAVAHSLRLRNTPQLVTQILKSSQISISRLSIGPEQFGMTPRIPPEDTFILAMYLTKVPTHELLRGGRPFLRQGYAQHAMRIVNLVDGFSADISCAHETLVFYLPRNAIDDVTAEAGNRPIETLSYPPGTIDPAVLQLGTPLLRGFEHPQELPSLFVDHVTQALCLHLAHRYGGFQAKPSLLSGGLSPRQAARAKDFLAAHFAEDITLRDVAQECRLSPAYFIRAFRRTIGVTPHQWLLRHRVERAKTMIANSTMSLGEIALACGFADQSHLTRIFKAVVGDSPGNWRRRRE